jgi:hypothetical protein
VPRAPLCPEPVEGLGGDCALSLSKGAIGSDSRLVRLVLMGPGYDRTEELALGS